MGPAPTLNLWKDSSIATVIGVTELMYQAARVESSSFRSAEVFAFTTSAYLVVSLAITGLAGGGAAAVAGAGGLSLMGVLKQRHTGVRCDVAFRCVLVPRGD